MSLERQYQRGNPPGVIFICSRRKVYDQRFSIILNIEKHHTFTNTAFFA